MRDHVLGKPVKDWDIEVFGIEGTALHRLLRRHGRVSAVGKAFGVYKLRAEDGLEIDVSIPRRDSKVGPGHRGIGVEGDPAMSVDEAVRRRDLTINAMMLDLNSGTITDPANGMVDLRARVLRAVDAATFLEDPLRALRVVQFAARLDFAPVPELLDLCRQAPLHELPAERILGEWAKLLTRGIRPSRGLEAARSSQILERLFPRRTDDPRLDLALDRRAASPRSHPEGRELSIGLLIFLSASSSEDAVATLDTLGLFRFDGFNAREAVIAAHSNLKPTPRSDAELRQASARCELGVLLPALEALSPKDEVGPALARARELGIEHGPPAPLLLGRHLPALGVSPGPQMGILIQQVYALQLDGTVTTAEEALDAARRLLMT